MEAAITDFLNGISARIFWIAAAGFVVINGATVAAFLVTRSRRLVDAWPPKLVATDAVLVGAGLGVPLLLGAVKFGVHALSALVTGAMSLFK
jgi:hypothetical protein